MVKIRTFIKVRLKQGINPQTTDLSPELIHN